MAEPTKIMSCSCKSKTQDTLYGPSLRLHNYATKPGNYRCTVCGLLHSPNGPTPVKKAEDKAEDKENRAKEAVKTAKRMVATLSKLPSSVVVRPQGKNGKHK